MDVIAMLSFSLLIFRFPPRPAPRTGYSFCLFCGTVARKVHEENRAFLGFLYSGSFKEGKGPPRRRHTMPTPSRLSKVQHWGPPLYIGGECSFLRLALFQSAC